MAKTAYFFNWTLYINIVLDLSLCKDVNIKIYHEIKEGVVLDSLPLKIITLYKFLYFEPLLLYIYIFIKSII